MSRQEHSFKELFARAGIAVNGDNPWDIQVNDERVYARVLAEKNLGLGESYMDGWWKCGQIDELISRILKGALEKEIRANFNHWVSLAQAVLFNRQSKRRSHQVAEEHYDQDNSVFMSFLDQHRQYSCAYFNGTDSLDQAQLNKLDLICRKINLSPKDHVLDIGSGWGGFAKYAAENYGCNVTGINISQEQIRHAKEFCKGLPVEILDCDYRDVRGCFDKIISVGMFEHVGYKNYRSFMEVAHRSLREDGIFLLHTIGSNKSGVNTNAWLNKYIFPNGMLPSIAQISRAAEGLFVLEDLHNMGPHYEKTLLLWNQRFQVARAKHAAKHGERFCRMWEYYLLSCAGAFRARDIQIWQFVFTKYGTAQPECRL